MRTFVVVITKIITITANFKLIITVSTYFIITIVAKLIIWQPISHFLYFIPQVLSKDKVSQIIKLVTTYAFIMQLKKTENYQYESGYYQSQHQLV